MIGYLQGNVMSVLNGVALIENNGIGYEVICSKSALDNLRESGAVYTYLAVREDDISLYINSPGGSITSGMAIYDTMNLIKSDVSTICVGMAASMGAFLLAAGTKGKRIALPNSEIMIHQPLGQSSGQVSDVLIRTELLVRTRQMLNELLAKNTGRSIEEIARDTERDNFMTAQQALEYGLIDRIIEHH